MTQVDTVLVNIQRQRRHRKKPPQPFDKRTGAGRRAAMLADHFRRRLGPVADDPVVAGAIERAAQLQALAEAARARALRSDPHVTLDDVVRLNRLSESAVRALRLDRHDTKQALTFTQQLALERQP
jgi:hypothetical protein